MNYYQQDFMIKLGETVDGRIIEVPDLIIFGAGLMLLILIVSLANKNK
tara:strand:+ start:283 stop:426 length:144 start_codon:yes stop_codon:yes gene_type:complete